MVTQYLAQGQGDALVRFFQSRQLSWEGVSLARIRKMLWGLVKPHWVAGWEYGIAEGEQEAFYKGVSLKARKVFQDCWRQLLDKHHCDLNGDRYVVFEGDLVAL